MENSLAIHCFLTQTKLVKQSSSADPSMATPGIVQLFIVFLGSMAVGNVFACLLRPHDQICTSEQPLLQSDSVNSVICNRSFVKSGFSLLFEKKMLLLILIFLYMGLQRAFIWYVFFVSIPWLACFSHPVNAPYFYASTQPLDFLLSVCIISHFLPWTSFDRGDFTRDIITPAFGVSWVGGVMAVFSAADAIVS
jgi:hypothetical protein